MPFVSGNTVSQNMLNSSVEVQSKIQNVFRVDQQWVEPFKKILPQCTAG